MRKWTKVGTVGVDAGMVWIGDPCYLSREAVDGYSVYDTPRPIPSQWDQFCSWLTGEPTQVHPVGMVIRSGYGDGEYPVSVRRTDDGHVAEMRVVFIQREEH